jgi:hypothetical protein
MRQDLLIALELIAGVGALAMALRSLVPRKTAGRDAGRWGLVATWLLAALGALLLVAAGLLLGGASQGRLVSVEAGVFFAGWVGAHLATTGLRHWLQPVALALGVAIVALGFLLPSPG